MKRISLNGREVGEGEPTFVIAEAGSNHNVDLDIAKELIDAAAKAGADAVKFQTFRAKNLYVEESGEADYLNDDRSLYDIIESLEMPYDWIPELHDYCRENGLYFMSTPFDRRSAEELKEYLPAFKIASYTLSHHPFLEELADMGKPLMLSTGAHDLDEVTEAVDALRDHGMEDIVLLQCVAAYPTPLQSINVKVVETLREEFGTLTGLSDHTQDPVTAPAAAVAIGASVVEKHFTLDREMEGPDHVFALEPDELEEMVMAIRKTERSLGDGEKEVQEVERELHQIARRGIHAVEEIQPGDIITKENIEVLRSGKQEQGLPPKHYEKVLGKKAMTKIPKSKGIKWEFLEGD